MTTATTTTTTATKQVLVYKLFERFWHWSQAFLILTLSLTGFEVHGFYSIFGFETAVAIHNFCAFTWSVLLVFIFFWLFITGEWKQFIPTKDGLGATLNFYMSGIFKGEHHPHKKTELSKLNPLQRIVYTMLKIVFLPVMLVTGMLYYYFHELGVLGTIDNVALLHTFMAFVVINFVIIHVYMTTTGHTPLAHIKAMITGYDDLEVEGHGGHGECCATPKAESKSEAKKDGGCCGGHHHHK